MPLDRLGKLLGQQHGVASRAQLLALGMPDRAMQYRLRAGPWQALLPGIYLSVAEPPSFAQKEMAALLYAGPDSLVTGPAALTHHGIRSPAAMSVTGSPPDMGVIGSPPGVGVTGSPAGVGVIDVLVPVKRQRLDMGFVRLHRTARMPARTLSAGPVRVALAPRAVTDTAWQLTSPADVRAVVTDAIQSGRCTLDELAIELSEGPIRGSAALRSVLAELAAEARPAARP
jgi:hypothetical protein